jgi:hypothetical protein
LLKVCVCCGKCSEKMSKCAVCKKQGLKKYYCGKACQEKDWSKHKKIHKLVGKLNLLSC